MKNSHIIILVAIAAAIIGLLTFSVDFSTYDSIESAKKKPGKFVHVIAQIDLAQPIEYDPVKNPNYLSFIAKDSLGGSIRVIYKNSKPESFEKSTRIVMKGSVENNIFQCKEILLKCPSKYKDDPAKLEKAVEEQTKGNQ